MRIRKQRGLIMRGKKGFTLVEVMVTVGILSLLAIIIIPNALRHRITANDTVAKATLKTISTALENYMSDNNRYPNDVNDLTTANPPYLNTNYFNGTYNGFNFTATLQLSSYTVTATPIDSSHGTTTFTISPSGTIE